MSKFSAGRKVRVYNGAWSPTIGTITDVIGDHVEVLEEGSDLKKLFHMKQVRRLKPKAPRKSFWVCMNSIQIDYIQGATTGASSASHQIETYKCYDFKHCLDCVEHREVRKPK